METLLQIDIRNITYTVVRDKDKFNMIENNNTELVPWTEDLPFVIDEVLFFERFNIDEAKFHRPFLGHLLSPDEYYFLETQLLDLLKKEKLTPYVG